MKISIRLIAAGALLAAGLPLTASAQTISISATVNSQCNIGTATVNFAAITLDTFQQSISNSITITCNKGATPFVALNNGLNANVTQKRMQRGATGDFINYNISVPNILTPTTTGCPGLPGGTEWNAANRLDMNTMFTSNGGPRDVLICAFIPAGQGFNFGAGTYNDTVTATVSFT